MDLHQYYIDLLNCYRGWGDVLNDQYSWDEKENKISISELHQDGRVKFHFAQTICKTFKWKFLWICAAFRSRLATLHMLLKWSKVVPSRHYTPCIRIHHTTNINFIYFFTETETLTCMFNPETHKWESVKFAQQNFQMPGCL